MKKVKWLLGLLGTISVFSFVACNNANNNENNNGNDNPPSTQFIDYVDRVKLNKTIEGKTFKADGIEEVTLYQSVDGDTIHVYNHAKEVLKLRFVGVDTPESTSAIEPWGKEASNFTKSKVTTAESLVITSEDGGPGANDSYGRWLAFVWYKAKGATDYRLLNLELVQESYSVSKNTGELYRDDFVQAANQARIAGKKVWGEKDPNYCYSGPKEISLMELREDLMTNGKDSQYLNQKVVFDATVARYTQSVGYTYYLVDTDLDSGKTYGIQAYSIKVGTGKLRKTTPRVRISGTVVWYENGNTFQLSDIVDLDLSKNPDNLKLIEENYELTPLEVTAASELATSNKAIEFQFVSLKNLVVGRCSTTTNDDSSNKGAITIHATLNGQEVTVRTVPLIYNGTEYAVDSNKVVLQSNFEGKVIDVLGIVEYYYGNYQIKVVSMDDINIH